MAGGINTYAYVENDPLRYVDPEGLARNVIGSPVESHNGGKEHIHWGPEKNPRKNAVCKDGTIRHGKKPPRKIRDQINKLTGWNLTFPLIMFIPPNVLHEKLHEFDDANLEPPPI